jgi:opine dehydrogenase
LRGFEINLFELPEFKEGLDPIIKRKSIEVVGAISGNARLNYVGTNIAEATKNVGLIMVVIPAMGHKKMAGLLASHIRDGQIVYVNPGSTFGGLEFVKIFKEMGVNSRVSIAETSTLTYGARRVGKNKVRITLESKEVLEGVFPARDTAEISKVLRKVYPNNETAKNIMEASLNNLNPSLHPPATLLSASTIENKGRFNLYKDGISPSVARVIEAVDNERLALCRELGFREWPLKEQTTVHGYSPGGETLYETLHSEIFESLTESLNLNHRFLLEDVQYGIVSFASLGEQLGVPMPTCRAIIELTSKIHGVNYWEEGKRSMKYLGLDGMNKDDLSEFLLNGR